MIPFGSVARERALWLMFAAVLLLTVGLLAGCGGSSGPTTTAGVPGSVTTSSRASGGQTTQVIMAGRAYDPQDITIRVGDTVTWVNQDAPQHDVVADNGEFKSSLFDKGQSFSFTFTKAGTYPYHCSIHPGMAGTVTVQ